MNIHEDLMIKSFRMAYISRLPLLFPIVFVLLCPLLSGCGYHHSERAGLPPWIKTIYVAPWSNRSNEFLLGTWITEDLRHEFLRGRALELAPKEEADVILIGKVVEIRTSGLSYIRYDQAIERRISAECAVYLIHRKTGRVLWKTGDIVREEGFLVGRSIMETEDLKDEALHKISQDVADIVYHRITGIF